MSGTSEGPGGSARFDWLGVRVGHWLVVGAGGYDKVRRPLFGCISRCGVASRLTRGELAAGGSKTCEACHHRGRRAAPDRCRVLSGAQLAEHQQLWERNMIAEEKTNLKGKEAVADWEGYGRAAVASFLDAAGFGADFGWRLFIRDCHERAKPKAGRDAVRAKSFNPGSRRIELLVRPLGGRYSYEVDVTTGRSDVPFEKLRLAFEKLTASGEQADDAAQRLASSQPAAAQPAPEPPAPPPQPASLSTVLAGVDLDQLVSIRDRLDTVHTQSLLMRETEAKRRDAEAQLARLRERLAPLAERLTAARSESDRRAAARQELLDYAARLREKLAELDESAAAAAVAVETAQAELAAATEAHAPVAEEFSLAELALDDVLKELAAREQQAKEAEGLMPLLMALSKMGR